MRYLWIAILLLAVGCSVGCRPAPAPIPEATQMPVPSPTDPVAPTSTPALDATVTPTPRSSPEPTPTAMPEATSATPEGGEAMTPIPTLSEEPDDEGPLLRMVYIRAESSREVQKLRGMPLVDIVMVRPDPDRTLGDDKLSGGFIVEAVVARDVLAKLKATGFDVSEVPPHN